MKRRLLDLTGQRYGRLTVLREAERKAGKHRRWVCLCDCGQETTVWMTSLRNGETVSCGCRRREWMPDNWLKRKPGK